KATNAAIGSAIAAIMQGLSYSVVENVNQTGATQMGHFVVTLDDGSGTPSANLLSTVQQAVDAIRPVGTSFAVQGPVVTLANVSMTLTTDGSADHAQAVAAVAAAVEAYIAALPVGGVLSYTRLAQLAYDAASAVTNISGLLSNGATADIVPGSFGAVRAGVIAVS
ncbi:MAG: baseplate J/gp47 family protein, partial [Rhodospirillales bacterium]|nr:baseplate J/gp47 family protein [Rhodospirillales bacterium]